MANKQLNQSRTSTSRCQPCNVPLGPDNPAYDHYHSRAHINRLLQLGLEIPLEEERLVDDSEHADGPLPKMPRCGICDTIVGQTPQEAAQHYRSREHINKRLQQGLPVAVHGAAAVKEETDQRHVINQFLRHGIQANSNGPMLPTSSVQPKVMNGKRKLPVPAMGGFGPHSSSVAPQFSGFAQEKRPCRPVGSLHKGSLQLSSSGQFGSSFSPVGSLFRPGASVRTQNTVTRTARPPLVSNQWSFDTVQQSTMAPRAWMYNDVNQHSASAAGGGVFADHGGAEYHDPQSLLYNNQGNTPTALYDQQGSVLYGSSQSTVFTEHGSIFSDGWFCDLCNIALPTAIALNQHTNSAEHQLAAEWTRARGQGHSLYQ